MDEIAKTLLTIDIQDEMRASYLDYSMSVIIGRALPDVRDGLKPVHRRILYAMFREGLLSNRRYSKCAGVVGEVLKKYHPHGDSAVYDALVRMAQTWNMRVPLVDGQGNFGSVDGDPAAAYRYTECRLTRIAETLLSDIDKDTVNFGPNFDGSNEEPLVLPSAYPNLLVNGSDGIAVGMATKIPPHNLGEAIDGLVAIIDNPEIELADLMQIIPGPDFPTAGMIYGRQGILDAYSTGRGKVIMRGRADFEEIGGGRWAIIIDELPYQVNKARLIENIADLVKSKRMEGISALRDESDRRGMRIVIELKRESVKEVILNQLYKHTTLQNTFGVHLLAIVNNRPMTMTLKDMLTRYLAHRRDVTVRRCRYDLRKALARLHILEGYLIALDNLDLVIKLIRASRTPDEARPKLMDAFGLSEIQAQAILNMRLQRLTGMEREKLELEQQELRATVKRLEEILDSESELLAVIRGEVLEVKEKFSNPRRTVIMESTGELSIQDLIPDEEQILTLSARGYIKRTSMDEYQEQRRGGKGRRGMRRRNEDYAQDIFIASTHSYLLVFTVKGLLFRVPVYAVPNSHRDAIGTPIINLVPIEKDDKIASVLSIRSFEEEVDLFFCSKKGLVKKTALSKYRNVRTSGLIAYECNEGDELLAVQKASDSQRIFITTKLGFAIHFEGSDVRQMGRRTRGVRGIQLRDGDEICGVTMLEKDVDSLLLTVTEKGYGKRSPVSEYRVQRRAGLGIIDIRTGDRNGLVAGTVHVDDSDRIILITNKGQVIRIPVTNIRETHRNTLGVRLMRVGKGERIVSIAKLVDSDDESESDVDVEEIIVETDESETPAEEAPKED
jgi:DNA gyrase subunit A